MYSGLSGRSIHFNDWVSTPGAGTGADMLGTTHPALWLDAPVPASLASTTHTSAPSAAKASAEHNPIEPAPITVTLMEICPLLTVGDRHLSAEAGRCQLIVDGDQSDDVVDGVQAMLDGSI